MKKFRVVFIIIVGLSFAAMWYTQVYSETQSVYLLALELIGLVVLFIGLIVTIIRNEGKSKIYKVFIICSYLFLLGFLGRQDITEYKEMTCQDKYGRSFNLARRRLGVPEIPADWHIFGRGNGFVSWVANKTDIGHKVKHIEIDSSCRIEVEDDGYKLKPLKGVSRYMSVKTSYSRGKGSDTVLYYYQVGDDKRLISKTQADSLFIAEKISKN